MKLVLWWINVCVCLLSFGGISGILARKFRKSKMYYINVITLGVWILFSGQIYKQTVHIEMGGKALRMCFHRHGNAISDSFLYIHRVSIIGFFPSMFGPRNRNNSMNANTFKFFCLTIKAKKKIMLKWNRVNRFWDYKLRIERYIPFECGVAFLRKRMLLADYWYCWLATIMNEHF